MAGGLASQRRDQHPNRPRNRSLIWATPQPLIHPTLMHNGFFLFRAWRVAPTNQIGLLELMLRFQVEFLGFILLVKVR